MKLWLAVLLCAGSSGAFGDQDPEVNINSRYTVESIDIAGAHRRKISSSLRDDLQKLVGGKLDHKALDDLARRIREELHVPKVAIKIEKGNEPEHVRVTLEISERKHEVGASLSKLAYNSKQGWSGRAEFSTEIHGNRFAFGGVNDGDTLVERQAGISAGYQRLSVGTDRVQLRFKFETLHDQWNRSTIAALDESPDVPGIYRNRQNFQPTATFILAEPLTFSTGVSFERFQTQFPAARHESANSLVNTLRFHRDWEDSGADKHVLEAGYNLRAATRVLDSDFVYARHEVDAKYTFRRQHQKVRVSFLGGAINGRAPLFERFVLGNDSTLRGWNKFDLDPVGGTRVAHGSFEYKYRGFQIFYDTGAIWDKRKEPEAKHSLGVGFQEEGLTLAVAFPIRQGRAEPVFIAGFNF